MSNQNKRRDFIKKAAYIAPVIMTLASSPSIAQSGSGSIRPARPARPTHGGAQHGGGQHTRTR